jgi:hypothetical protein
MGVDLTLLVFTGDNFSHTMLDLERRSGLWECITAIENMFGWNVPIPFYSFYGTMKNGERGYGDTQTTPYGDRLKYVHVKQLKPLSSNQYVLDNYNNRAVWAYLEQLPDDVQIALYWH